MKIAFAIVTLFSAGGLQRDCMAIAARLAARGHEVTIFAERCKGDIPAGLNVELLPNRAVSNHRRDLKFAEAVVARCAGRFDRVVGFGKLLGLDVLYCADPCLAARRVGWLARWSARRRIQLLLEADSFRQGLATVCMLLSDNQARDYRSVWSTEPDRVEVLPPTIDLGRRHPEYRTDGTRERLREGLGIAASDQLWLSIANQPSVKGLDRTLTAMRPLPEVRLAVAGIKQGSKQAGQVLSWARGVGVADRVHLLGFRADIPELMAAADLLVHPARYDTTGTVILESLINGLPVITTADCGYAAHVVKAKAGQVISTPFTEEALTAALAAAAPAVQRDRWSANGIAYGLAEDLYRGLDRAADIIENPQLLADGR
ncbi:Glycosyl transferase, group 1 [Rhodopseudomonas palustris HaA2]|uniref:Glycosyl transferase, group 1 n=1 Tax=Rhodopseudomonas palustris (strain HaA2) TaxID=316058 RepID=Q2IVY3_RHOP2|nr:glycosyltransferase family 4 protein [Rhodopseudomonas palustris]ABD07627.1 Glycosyl transferase, group 1 [Rhodopseudomonas palustris HaA2]